MGMFFWVHEVAAPQQGRIRNVAIDKRKSCFRGADYGSVFVMFSIGHNGLVTKRMCSSLRLPENHHKLV